MKRLFLLSPARMNGVRAGYLLNPRASFDLARQFHAEGITLAEAFTFASGLYFRGKLAYARRFGAGKEGAVRVITTNAGLIDPEQVVRPTDLRKFGDVAIHQDDPRFHGPLREHLRVWTGWLGKKGQAILLGSVATGKYREVLLEALGDRLFFPADFVGRGDMSRGALLLHASRAGKELPCVPVAGATFSGRRAGSWQAALQRLP